MVREGMRGDDQQQNHMFSYLSPEMRVRKDHPLRAIRVMVDEVLTQLSRRFDGMYATVGRPSIAPEKLLRAQLLQMLYSIRSERLLMEEMDYNLLFRWFVGLNADDAVWDATVFTKNRDRLLEADVAQEFLARVVEQARGKGLTSDEHFTVDGTLLEAWASLKSFQPKEGKPTPPPDDPGNPTVNFRGEKRSNETHESKTDPDSLLARKSADGMRKELFYVAASRGRESITVVTSDKNLLRESVAHSEARQSVSELSREAQGVPLEQRALRPTLREQNLRDMPPVHKQTHNVAQEVAGPSNRVPTAGTEQTINQANATGGQKQKHIIEPSHYFGISL